MVNKKIKIIIVSLLIVFAILAVTMAVKSPTKASEISEVSSPISVQPVSEQATTLSEDSNSVTCQQPLTGTEYGGIGGNENSPPKGTVIDSGLTKQYNRQTATGVCGTYWYIAGWWFNASEMAKLPSETISYGVSPYAITAGSNGGSNGGAVQSGDRDDGNEDGPIPPIPEIATIILVAFGIFAFVAWKKIKK